jgi:hypothetical protein
MKTEVTLSLANVDDSDFQKAERHHGVVRAAPTSVHGTAELKRFDDAWGRTQSASALQAARGIEAVEMEPGEMRRWVEQNIERIRSGLGDEFAISRPVKQGRPAPTDMKGPGARHADHAIDENHAQHEELEEVYEKPVAPSRHALEYIRGRSSVKDNSEEIAKRASDLPDSRARNKTFPISFYEILLSK